MKKVIKITAFILLISVIGISFCGCNALDEMKASQAFLTEEGKILYGDTEYLPLPECEELQPIMSNETKYIFVTSENVPVLLSQFICEEYQVSGDGKFLCDVYDEINYYCRSDIYASVTERIENGFTAKGYIYSYYDYYTDTTKYYRFTAEQQAALETVISGVYPETLPKIAEINCDYSLLINACSDDMVFSSYAYDLYLNGNEYYLCKYKDEKILMYPVPDSMSDIFAEIMEEYIAAEKAWYE